MILLTFSVNIAKTLFEILEKKKPNIMFLRTHFGKGKTQHKFYIMFPYRCIESEKEISNPT